AATSAAAGRMRGERVELTLVAGCLFFAKTHRREIGGADFGRLAGLEDVALETAPSERIVHDLGAREAREEILALGDRQPDRPVDFAIANDRFGIAPRC